MRRIVVVFITSMTLVGIAQAEPDNRVRAARSKADLQKVKPVRVPANPCAQFGAGFARVEGSDTCIRIGGNIGIDVGGSSGTR